MSQFSWQNYNGAEPVKVMASNSLALQQFMTQVFTWMSMGLALTGLMASLTSSSESMLKLVFGSPLIWVLFIAQIGLVFALPAMMRKGVAFEKLFVMFMIYSVLNGITLASIFLVYTATSIATTFFVTAGTFGGMALYGYITKRDLTRIGSFMQMGVWGLMLCMLVNIFLKSSVLELGVSLLGVLIFTVLTAYDTQKLKEVFHAYQHDNAMLKNVGLMGALTLYLDFINMFIFLLRFLGVRRSND